MSIRGLNDNIKESLLKGDSFAYAHLVKFERVIRTVSSKPAETATDYSYITDGSTNIVWNDGSTDVNGTANGDQTYIANRLKSVGDISETVDAKASSMSISLASTALGTTIVSSPAEGANPAQGISLTTTNNSYPYTATIDLLDVVSPTFDVDTWTERGFTEGDKVTITHSNTDHTWHGIDLVINSFSDNNTLASCTIIGTRKPSSNVSNETTSEAITVSLETDEIKAILNDPNDTTYAGYINREVFIYKTHINPTTGAIIGAPYLIFKGIIAKVQLKEDVNKASNVIWSLTSHWGDFIRVNGRVTSDSEHRALGGDGTPDPASLHRYDYATDYGFMHGEQAINIIAIYQVMETRYKMKSSGLFGLKKKLVEYQVEVDRDVDLRFNLEAKYLPVVYGVNRIDSVPIFADTAYSDSGEIYCIYALCEGEVSGIYDIYIDDQSRICVDKNDSDTRSSQTSEKTIDVICEGRMDRGDTLSSAASSNRQEAYFKFYGMNSWESWGWGGLGRLHGRRYGVNKSPVLVNNSDAGMTHEQQTTFDYPIQTQLIFHAGRSHQRSDDMITGIAEAGKTNTSSGFKLQGDLDYKDNYWSTQHRLLDTAYAVAKFQIAEGDVTIPQMDFVIRGREIEQYNYDYSYPAAPNTNYDDAKRAKYAIGDTVDIYKSDGTALAQDIQIVDLFKYINARKETIWKYRFSTDPRNGNTATKFRMVQNTVSYDHADHYEMVTWDHKSLTGTVTTTLYKEVVTSSPSNDQAQISNNSGGTGVDLTNLPTDLREWITYLSASGGVTISFMGATHTLTADDLLNTLVQFQLDSGGTNPNVTGSSGSEQLTDVGDTQEGSSTINKVLVTNAIHLNDATTNVDNFYKGQTVIIRQAMEDGSVKTQSRLITGYDASRKVAFVGSLTDVETNSVTVGTWNTTQRYTSSNSIQVTQDVSSLNTLLTASPPADLVIAASNPYANNVPVGIKINSVTPGTKTLHLSGQIQVHSNAALIVYRSTDGTGTVADPEPFEFVPLGTDVTIPAGRTNTTYEVLPPGDKKASINPALQLLDYIQSKRYGRGLELGDGTDKDIKLSTWLNTARLCDTRSDVTLILANAPSSGAYNVGDSWQFKTTDTSSNVRLQWQGTIKSIDSTVTYNSTTYKQVTFEDCIGKIAHKWYDWKQYERGQVVYHRVSETNRLYQIDHTDPATIAAPSGSGATSLTLTKKSAPHLSTTVFIGTGGVNGASDRESSWDYNPVVKQYDSSDGDFSINGYSLYDSDDVIYWRYLGWQDHNQREVTRHQTNSVIRTDTPVFDNVNSMLEHFNGILRFSNGMYELDIKTGAPTIPSTLTVNGTAYTEPRRISEDDIIGAITVDDAGLKGSANQVSVSIPDPAIRYDKRSVSFFDSTYLKEDRGVTKKKSIKTPLISNYFNARINAEQYLIDSRYSLKINFVMGPKGVLLLAGSVILITYPRFNWTDKPFRITNLRVKQDCLVQVTAELHDDSVYKISGKKKKVGDFQGPNSGGPPAGPAPQPPINLTATTGNASLTQKIRLEWENTPNYGQTVGNDVKTTWKTEIHINDNSDYSAGTGGKLHLTVVGNEEAVDLNFSEATSDLIRYFWVRHVRNGVPSLWEPAAGGNPGTGVTGTALGVVAGASLTVYLYKVVASGGSMTDADISGDTHFPNITVNMVISSNDYGNLTITGQSSAALTSGQVIGTDGNGTGWYTTPQASTAGHTIYQVSQIAKSTDGTNATLTKANWTTPKAIGTYNPVALAAPKTGTGYLYYQTNQAIAPSAPSDTNVRYVWSDGTMVNVNGGSVIGTSGQTWNVTAPEPEVGTSSAKTWYIYYNVEQDSPDQAQTQPDFDDTVRPATNFVGLVRFTSTNTVVDGDGDTLSFGPGGTTTIDGGSIITDTITTTQLKLSGTGAATLASFTNDENFVTTYRQSSAPTSGMALGDLWIKTANELHDKYYRYNGSAWETISPLAVGGWTLNANSLYSVTGGNSPITSSSGTYTAGAGNVTIASGGAIHMPNFYANADGNVGVRGTIEISDGSGGFTTVTNDAFNNSNTAFKTNSTLIGQGIIRLQSSNSGTDTNRIDIDSSTNNIKIYAPDANGAAAIRVKLGNLS